jgi:hypothetical protein
MKRRHAFIIREARNLEFPLNRFKRLEIPSCRCALTRCAQLDQPTFPRHLTGLPWGKATSIFHSPCHNYLTRSVGKRAFELKRQLAK